MGYYTNYILSYELPKEEQIAKEHKEFQKECAEKGIKIPSDINIKFKDNFSLEDNIIKILEKDNWCDYSPLIHFTDNTADNCTWYNHEIDMKFLSQMFPTVLFILHGLGEENDDMWIKYFKNGKMQVCEAQITYPEFDESKLK